LQIRKKVFIIKPQKNKFSIRNLVIHLTKIQDMKKKVCSVAALSIFSLAAFAQLQVETKSFDLESVKKEKWKMFSGYKSPEGNLVIKLGQPKCDQVTSSGVVTTNGVAWDFEELEFDKDLNYLKSTSKNFSNSAEALQYEPVWGKTFSASNVSFANGGSLENLNPSDFGKTFVMPTASAIGTGKVSTARVESEVKGVLNSKGTAAVGCNQYPVLKILSSESVKDEKGQKWALGKAFPSSGSAVMFFSSKRKWFP
jgi:hypothetical protein